MKVDFYIVKKRADRDADLVCCRLVEKAYLNGVSAFVLTESADKAREIHDLIWTFKQGSFIPHEMDDSKDAAANIFVGFAKPENQTKMMINLTSEVPEFYTDFNRIAEIVPFSRKPEGRKCYKFYKDTGSGIELNTHDV